jgi:peptidoglycan/xylan/chitin deacetylase (PgdA/CDA1 family)
MSLLLEKYHIQVDTCKDILWLSKNEISYLSQSGHFIGLHSHIHPTKIEAMSKQEQENEYLTNYQILQEITHQQIFSMSHPCNSYNETTIEILKSLNIKIGFRSNHSKKNYLCYELPRIDHTYLIKS